MFVVLNLHIINRYFLCGSLIQMGKRSKMTPRQTLSIILSFMLNRKSNSKNMLNFG